MEDWKIKIAALWLVSEFGMITLDSVMNYLVLIGEMIAEGTPELIMVVVITYLIPPILAFLSLTLKDSINRWLNIIVGIVFLVLLPIGTGFEMFPAAYLPSIIVIAIVQVVALVLIVWYAWKSKQKA